MKTSKAVDYYIEFLYYFLKYVRYLIMCNYYYVYHLIFKANVVREKSITEKIKDFENIQKDKFHKTFIQGSQLVDYNSNIDLVIYNKKELDKLLEDENNYLEKQWRTRILYQTTPFGGISMFYDIYKSGFSYYCDQSVPYNILNALAMRYVILK
jgi:hypothetical protein